MKHCAYSIMCLPLFLQSQYFIQTRINFSKLMLRKIKQDDNVRCVLSNWESNFRNKKTSKSNHIYFRMVFQGPQRVTLEFVSGLHQICRLLLVERSFSMSDSPNPWAWAVAPSSSTFFRLFLQSLDDFTLALPSACRIQLNNTCFGSFPNLLGTSRSHPSASAPLLFSAASWFFSLAYLILQDMTHRCLTSS